LQQIRFLTLPLHLRRDLRRGLRQSLSVKPTVLGAALTMVSCPPYFTCSSVSCSPSPQIQRRIPTRSIVAVVSLTTFVDTTWTYSITRLRFEFHTKPISLENHQKKMNLAVSSSYLTVTWQATRICLSKLSKSPFTKLTCYHFRINCDRSTLLSLSSSIFVHKAAKIRS
jgi:hypothetical protein